MSSPISRSFFASSRASPSLSQDSVMMAACSWCSEKYSMRDPIFGARDRALASIIEMSTGFFLCFPVIERSVTCMSVLHAFISVCIPHSSSFSISLYVVILTISFRVVSIIRAESSSVDCVIRECSSVFEAVRQSCSYLLRVGLLYPSWMFVTAACLDGPGLGECWPADA